MAPRAQWSLLAIRDLCSFLGEGGSGSSGSAPRMISKNLRHIVGQLHINHVEVKTTGRTSPLPAQQLTSSRSAYQIATQQGHHFADELLSRELGWVDDVSVSEAFDAPDH